MTECPDLAVLEAKVLAADISAHVAACASCRLVMELREPATAEDDCARYEALLAARADGMLGRAAAHLLSRHLASCEACRVIAETLAPLGDLEGDHASLPSVDPASYALGLEVARGGMGRILAARDLRIGRHVAVKELLGRSRQLAARFEREARVTARLQHPGIVPIYEIGRWPDGTPFYSMRMVEGRTLREAINAASTLAARLALLPAVLSAAEAVAFAHSQRVIHRDLTPSNVLVGAYGETVVIDWGLAKDLADATDKDAYVGPLRDKRGADDLTTMGAVIGTLAYMPPEQANGEAVDERADVYALGAILYHVLAGAAPYRDSRGDELLAAVKAGPPTPVELVAAGVPKDLASIVAKAMAREPDARYPSARELTAELHRFQTGRMVEAHEYTTVERMRRFVRRNRGAVVTTALAVAALAIVATVSVSRVVRGGKAARASVTRLLEEEGRNELLAGNGARALAYLEAAYRQNQDSPTLKLMLGLGLHDLASIERDLDCEGSPRAIQFSPDGRDMVASCGDIARVWRIDGLELRYQLGPFPGGFIDSQYSHDGKTLATWGDDGHARLWSAQTGALLHDLGHGDPDHAGATTVTWVSFTPDDARVSTTAYDGWARIWDAKTGAMVTEIQGSADPIFRQLYGMLSRDGTRLLTITHAGIANGWEIATGAKLEGFRHGARVLGGRLSPDGTRAVTCGMDGLLKVWDLESARLVVQLAGGTSVMWFCEFSDDGKRVLGTGHDGSAFVWDVASGAVVSAVRHGSQMINSAHFSHDGERFVTIGVGGSVKVWDTRTGGLLASHETRGGREARITPDGRFLVAARGDGRLRIWRAPFGPLAATMAVTEDDLVGASATRVVIATPSKAWGRIALRDFETGVTLATEPLHAPAAMTAAANRLVAMTDASTAAIVDLETGRTIASIALGAAPRKLVIADLGARFAACFADRCEVWSVDAGNRLATLDGASDAILSPDGERALAWSAHGPPRVWDVTARTAGPALAVASFEPIGFTRAGTRVATVTQLLEATYSVIVWDAATGFPVGSLDGLSAKPTLDREHRYLTAIQAERRVHIWDLQDDVHLTFTGEALQRAATDPITKFVVGITAQGNAVVVLDDDGRALARWPIAHDHPVVAQGHDYQYQVRAPQGDAWWAADGTIVTLSARLALWKTSHELTTDPETVHKLVSKHVPWRLANDHLVPVLARVHGTVWRGAERIPRASVALTIRTPPDVFESGSISYRGTDTKITRATLSSDEEGLFEGSGLAPGDYTLTVKDGAQTYQADVTVSVEDEAVDIHLDELTPMP